MVITTFGCATAGNKSEIKREKSEKLNNRRVEEVNDVKF
jgi:hypothetical protein